MNAAVILYARATATSGSQGERGSVSPVDHLTAVQLADHEALLRVRNRALAHVYVGERMHDDETWHEDLFFAVETDQGWKPAAASHRLQFHRPTLDRLRRQVPIAREHLEKRFFAHIEKLTAALNEVPSGAEIFARHTFDPVAKFGSAQAVAQVLRGRADGRTSFWD